MKVTFYGATGSIPSPSNRLFNRSEFGGNTTCILVEVGQSVIIIDMGSGSRLMGNDLFKRMPVEAHIFFTHLHWDHIQGMPFFPQLYIPGNKLHFHAQEKTKTSLHLLGKMRRECMYVSLRLTRCERIVHIRA